MTGPHYPNRRDVVRALLRDRGARLVVSGLGGTTWDVADCGDHEHNFYLWGGMGLAVSMGLGLALAQPAREVLVITGDGEMLMGLGSLASVAAQNPGNLSIAVIDNERYGETGEQLTHTAGATDLALAAQGAGIAGAVTLRDISAVQSWLAGSTNKTATALAVIKVTPGNEPMALPPRAGARVMRRFRHALGIAD